MNQLIVVAFDHLEDAREAMKRLREIVQTTLDSEAEEELRRALV